jgi:hypothetical protein
MPAAAINIRHIFHRRARCATILAVRIRRATAIWMSALLRCVIRHFNCLLELEFFFDRQVLARESKHFFDAQAAPTVAGEVLAIIPTL